MGARSGGGVESFSLVGELPDSARFFWRASGLLRLRPEVAADPSAERRALERRVDGREEDELAVIDGPPKRTATRSGSAQGRPVGACGEVGAEHAPVADRHLFERHA